MVRGVSLITPLILLFAFHVVRAGGLYAQSASPSYTVDALIRIALEKYEPLIIQESKAREAAALGRHLGEWYNPEIGLTAGRKTSGEVTGRQFGATVTQRISFPGKKGIMEEIALRDEVRARLSLEEMKLFIRYEVTRLAYEYAHHQVRTGHIRERLRRLRLINAYMQGRIMISPQKRVERSIIRSRIALLEREVYRIGTDMKAAFARLNLYAGIPGDALPGVTVKWFTRAPEIDTVALIARAKGSGFLVRIQKEALEGARKETALSKRNTYPDVGISAYFTDEKTVAAERSFGGGVSFPIPVFSRNQNAIDMSGHREKAEEYRLRHLERSVAEQVRELSARYEYASAMVKNFSVRDIGGLEDDMRYTDSEFRRGRVALATYLEMDTQTHEMLEEIFRSQLDLVNMYTSLLFLSAEEKPVDGDLSW